MRRFAAGVVFCSIGLLAAAGSLTTLKVDAAPPGLTAGNPSRSAGGARSRTTEPTGLLYLRGSHIAQTVFPLRSNMPVEACGRLCNWDVAEDEYFFIHGSETDTSLVFHWFVHGLEEEGLPSADGSNDGQNTLALPTDLTEAFAEAPLFYAKKRALAWYDCDVSGLMNLECMKRVQYEFHEFLSGSNCAGGHNTCGVEGDLLEGLVEAFKEGDDDGIIRLALASPDVARINAERNAVQVVDCGGKVVSHVPVSVDAISAWLSHQATLGSSR